MDSSDYARIHGDLVREEASVFALSRLWSERPDTLQCWSPSALAWQAQGEDIARQLHHIAALLASSRARVHRKWMEAIREEHHRRVSGVVG